jgi:hypothetical protein
VRIVLDAHISGRRVARNLWDDGHDVVALSEERDLVTLDDALVLEFAAREQRVLVTFNARDFVPLLREWAEARRSHVGCIFVYGLDHSQHGVLLDGLRRLFEQRPVAEDWKDVALVLPYAHPPRRA